MLKFLIFPFPSSVPHLHWSSVALYCHNINVVYSNIDKEIKHLPLTGFQSIDFISHDDKIMVNPTSTLKLDEYF